MSSSSGDDPEDFDDDSDEELIKEDEPPQTGCWAWFTNCVGGTLACLAISSSFSSSSSSSSSSLGMWATREMNPTDDREIFVRTTIRELVVYCIFLVVLCVRK